MEFFRSNRRILLVTVLFLGLALPILGFFGLQMQRWRAYVPSRDAAVARVEFCGGFVAYSGPLGQFTQRNDWFSDVVFVNLTLQQFSEEDFSAIVALRDVRLLMAYDSPITDQMVGQACKAWPLEGAYLSNTAITDEAIAHLCKEKTLEIVFVDNTRISEVGVERLCKLPRIKSLRIGGAKITDAKLASLRNRYPEIDIQ